MTLAPTVPTLEDLKARMAAATINSNKPSASSTMTLTRLVCFLHHAAMTPSPWTPPQKPWRRREHGPHGR